MEGADVGRAVGAKVEGADVGRVVGADVEGVDVGKAVGAEVDGAEVGTDEDGFGFTEVVEPKVPTRMLPYLAVAPPD